MKNFKSISQIVFRKRTQRQRSISNVLSCVGMNSHFLGLSVASAAFWQAIQLQLKEKTAEKKCEKNNLIFRMEEKILKQSDFMEIY